MSLEEDSYLDENSAFDKTLELSGDLGKKVIDYAEKRIHNLISDPLKTCAIMLAENSMGYLLLDVFNSYSPKIF